MVTRSRVPCLLVLILLVPGSSAAQLPDGPGKGAVVKVCGTCHDATTTAAVRLTREGWESKIADMVTRGASGTDEELQAVLEYLVAHFPAEAEALLDINTATAIELESVLELLRKESAALIAHREKVKRFDSLEDLKGIGGVPFAKIEAKKDRLTFGASKPAEQP